MPFLKQRVKGCVCHPAFIAQDGQFDGVPTGSVDFGMAESLAGLGCLVQGKLRTSKGAQKIGDKVFAALIVWKCIVQHVVKPTEKGTIQQTGVVGGSDDQVVRDVVLDEL